MQKFFVANVLLCCLQLGCSTTPIVDSTIKPRLNPLAGKQFYIDQGSVASKEAERVQAKDPNLAKTFKYLAEQPSAIWFGAWSGPIKAAVSDAVSRADKTGTQLVAVVYNAPYRDCGQHSAGGLAADDYKQWLNEFVAGLGQHKAVIILEPDAIPLITCLTAETKAERWQLLHFALENFKTKSQAIVYMDVGHSSWISAGIMAERLAAIGIDRADGFSINTSNYQSTEDSINYGRKLLRQFPGKGIVIDTSRNGNGPSPDNAWCNPRGRAIGQRPQVLSDNTGIDAYLWTKKPGESDGACNGGPVAGEFWPEVAKELVENAKVFSN